MTKNMVIHTYTILYDIVLVYTRLVGIDDAGATIDDKDDKLWRPSSRNTSEKSSPTKQKKLLIKHDERDELYTAEDSRKGH